ncbi:MAG: regulatory protein RecX [Gammaproteobacteria bacterium]|jgi:regulatory protein|nr:regulatory protein RecX [Gammaproteobacteria bacterium]MBT4462080.1 regulatory protein RecX [Gammaproteobacteria bacterium]MBT4654939.1 regulatory protein RecX [Gammaproteobacteria bacterium]MBT5116571.1 regulatory protein RecX [Gammaproteobacteria bacterium]MBT6331361.1 regulatory protein RecX [Gammaproteobacteria bacterium]
MSSQTADIKNSISRYLSMREHSRQELIEKLSKKDFDMHSILECIDEFSVKDLQSDYRYSESYTRSKYNNHKGPNFISASLKSKGISSSTINDVLSSYKEEDWKATAIAALEKKTIYKNIEPNKCKTKQKMFLSGRGFTFRTIEYALNEFWKK